MGKKLRRVNNGQVSTSVKRSSAIVPTPPRVSPMRITLIVWGLTVAGFLAIGADGWMSWKGFSEMPIDWWVAMTLTVTVAAAQLGSGVIQALGGNPFVGVGGSAEGDQLWGMVLRSLYALDIFSNYAGFGATDFLNLEIFLSNPGGTIGWIIWNAMQAVLLAFGDELLFRLRDRVAIGAKKNEQLSKLQEIRLKAHNEALKAYKSRAIEQGKLAGEKANVEFDWLESEVEV